MTKWGWITHAPKKFTHDYAQQDHTRVYYNTIPLSEYSNFDEIEQGKQPSLQNLEENEICYKRILSFGIWKNRHFCIAATLWTNSLYFD